MIFWCAFANSCRKLKWKNEKNKFQYKCILSSPSPPPPPPLISRRKKYHVCALALSFFLLIQSFCRLFVPSREPNNIFKLKCISADGYLFIRIHDDYNKYWLFQLCLLIKEQSCWWKRKYAVNSIACHSRSYTHTHMIGKLY